jgi:tRNA(fMet)-specific endonuclease VapC
MFFRGHPQVVARFQVYLAEYDTINLSMITYYEIVSGLKHRDAQKQLKQFLEFILVKDRNLRFCLVGWTRTEFYW